MEVDIKNDYELCYTRKFSVKFVLSIEKVKSQVIIHMT